MKTRMLLTLAAVAASATFASSCTDSPIDRPSGEVQIAIAPLEFPDIVGATFELTIFDSLNTAIYYNPAVSSDEYGTPDGRTLFVAPCSAGHSPTPGVGAPGTEINTVRIRLLEVRIEGGQRLTPSKGDAIFPPAVSRDVLCTENADVRADFLLTIARRAQQGFVDVVVQIQDIFCSTKVSCEQRLMADPESPYTPGPTLVTGFACTDGEESAPGTHYVGFTGELCCNGAELGDPSCTRLGIDPMTGEPVWSDLGVGVLDTQSYMDSEAIVGKVFHDTTWRLDPAAVDGGCIFYGEGFFNWTEDGSPASFEYFEGAEGVSPAPLFVFETAISNANPNGEMFCTPDIDIEYPDEETAFAHGDALATCFLDMPGVHNQRWGWTNGPLMADGVQRVFDLYAGAAHCDLDKGTYVGSVTVVYSGSSLTATFHTVGGWVMEESHLYVGSDPTPPDLAPGAYPYINETTGTTHTYTVSNLVGPVYLIGHAAVSH